MSLLIRYDLSKCITFFKTKETNGCLSNMAGGFPIQMGSTIVRTSEHLYQAMRFPEYPEIQRAVLAPASPMAAKMCAKKHKHLTRPDWDAVKVDIMEWCLQLKLLNNLDTFGKFLVECVADPSKDIVEISYKDDFWGAIPTKAQPNIAEGTNVLGRLLWILGRKHEIDLPISTKISVTELVFLNEDAIKLAEAGLNIEEEIIHVT